MLKAILIGAGDRGYIYAKELLKHPHKVKLVAVAEPNELRADKIKVLCPDVLHYENWVTLLEDNIDADIALICTQDKEHFQPVIQALQRYHVLLEKPMSPNAAECLEMVEQAKKNNKVLSVCHVLRYTPFWTNIKQLIDQDKIGDIISIQLNENVEIMHMSHSFVRGNWNNDKTSSPMILAKSCHDMDIINYILQSEVERISSFGNLMYFKENYKPEGAPIRCLEGCPYEQTCIFHAGNYYLGKGRGWAKKFTDVDTDEAIIEKLNTTGYGKCVFQSDNNVVDHQVVNMQCENGATVTFSMCGFTREQTRIVQIMGTKGEIRGNMDENKISTYTYLNEQEEVILLPEAYGHGGGDSGIIRDFLHTIDSNTESKSSAEKSMKSHMMAFAAEASRKRGGEPIVLSNFISNLA